LYEKINKFKWWDMFQFKEEKTLKFKKHIYLYLLLKTLVGAEPSMWIYFSPNLSKLVTWQMTIQTKFMLLYLFLLNFPETIMQDMISSLIWKVLYLI
jgi:hypothetical protein